MQDIRALRPPLGFPADHLGDLGLVEVRGLAGLGQALVGVAQHRLHDDLATALELPAEQLQGCVIPLGHPFSPGARDGGYKSIPSEIGFWRILFTYEYLPR